MGVFLISLGTLIALGSWILDGIFSGFSFAYKLKRFLSIRGLVLIVFIFLVHIIWLISTEDFSFAFRDLRNKLPLLALPIIFAGAPNLKESGRELLIKIFLLALFLSTLISFKIILFEEPNDIRNAMIFTSHIRIGLMLSLALFFIFHIWKRQNKIWKTIFIILAIWYLFFIYKAQLASGLLIFLVVAMVMAVLWAIKYWKSGVSRLVVLGTLGLLTFSFVYLKALQSSYFSLKDDISTLEQASLKGEKYIHDTASTFKENGHLVNIYFAPLELESAWNKRASILYENKDKKGQKISGTLKRYLASKGLRKDSSGIDSLSVYDIEQIELGTTNYLQETWNPIQKRFNELSFEWTAFENGANPSGNSFLMRTEFWKAGWSIFKNNLLLGVGTGDIRKELDKEYNRNGTMLEEKYRHRIHNQYLTFGATFGIVGLLIILFCLFYPVLIKNHSFIYISFVLIWALSFLTENTLETQAGVTFFAFFSSFFLVSKSE